MIAASLSGVAQSDSLSYRPNLIKINFTTRLLYPVAYVATYERVIKPYQSFSITGGYLELFGTGLLSGIKAQGTGSNGGFTLGGDYRFYMKHENKFKAPHGLYWGPFVGYYSFNKSWNLSNSVSGNAATLKSELEILNIGVQLGYQVVLKDRWAFDFIFLGPSLSNYAFKMDLNGNFTPDEENEVVQGILDKFPLLGDLVDGKTISTHGRSSSWAPGYRFTIQVGYKFGFGKK